MLKYANIIRIFIERVLGRDKSKSNFEIINNISISL